MATHDFIKYDAAERRWRYLSVPKILFFEDTFKDLSPEAAVLYSLFLDRATLSYKNGYIDNQGRIYILYSAQEVMEAMHCSINTTTKYFKELEHHNLIERKRQGQGKPTLIYVKEFIDSDTVSRSFLFGKGFSGEDIMTNIPRDDFTGDQIYTYAFFRIPMQLFEDPQFSKLSLSAKILYSLFLERLGLSKKNGWMDEDERFYIYYTLKDIMENMNCYDHKAVDLLDELENIGLIERVHQGQGAPSKIYVKDFIEHEKEQEKAPETLEKPKDSETHKNRIPKFTKRAILDSQKSHSLIHKNRIPKFTKRAILDSQDSHSNNLDNNKPNKSEPYGNNDGLIDGSIARACEADDVDNSSDGIIKVVSDSEGTARRKAQDLSDERAAMLEQIRENIHYNDVISLCRDHFDVEFVDGVIGVMLEAICSKEPMKEIGKEQIPTQIVKEKLLSLDEGSFTELIDRLRANGKPVKNESKYILTAAYNQAVSGATKWQFEYRDTGIFRPLGEK